MYKSASLKSLLEGGNEYSYKITSFYFIQFESFGWMKRNFPRLIKRITEYEL